MKIAVTGAYSYSGKYITHRLLSLGHEVITLTGHPHRPDPFAGQVKAYPLDFTPENLVEHLRGVEIFFNTYWVRFDRASRTHSQAVTNTRILINAARSAGVRRFIHTSITNPSLDSPLPYFSGKALNEQVVMDSGMQYAILRPTVLFGREDILVNNLAWTIRHFPFFGQIGDGQYQLQPVFVDDFAALAVQAGLQSENVLWDAVGPDIFTFDELVRLVGHTIGHLPPFIHLPPTVALTLSRFISLFVRDVILTREEVDALMSGLLVSSSPPRCTTRLSSWLKENQQTVGLKYASELARHF